MAIGTARSLSGITIMGCRARAGADYYTPVGEKLCRVTNLK